MISFVATKASQEVQNIVSSLCRAMQKISAKHSYKQYMPYTLAQFSAQELLASRKNTFRSEVLLHNDKYWSLGTNGSSSLETIWLFWHLYSHCTYQNQFISVQVLRLLYRLKLYA